MAIVQAHPNGRPGNKWDCVRDTPMYILGIIIVVGAWGKGGGGGVCTVDLTGSPTVKPWCGEATRLRW